MRVIPIIKVLIKEIAGPNNIASGIKDTKKKYNWLSI
tara:strand:- start:651 stop:761 length:111 start_codon:yes stop_codon:yes gene_type:complete